MRQQNAVQKEPDRVLETALAYIDAGLAVLPLMAPTRKDPGAGKRPVLKEWQNKKLTAQEFRAAYRPGMNLGVITGMTSGLVCIDLDGEPGLAWLEAHRDSLGSFLEEFTGSGGRHLYFRHPGNIAIPSPKLCEGVEIKADFGHQVVTAPSVHPDGGAYAIWNNLSLEQVKTEADYFPEWLLEIVIAHGNRTPKGKESNETFADHPSDIEAMKRMMRRYPAAVEGQSGDRTTVAMFMVCRDYGISPREAFVAAGQIYNPRCNPPWDLEQLRIKCSNAYAYAKGTAGSKSITNEFPPITEEEEKVIAEDIERRSLKEDKKKPYLLARTLLTGLDGKLKAAQETNYFYDESIQCWRILKNRAFRAELLREIERVYGPSASILLPRDTTNVCEAVLDELEKERFDATENRWLDGHKGGDDFVRLENGILDIRGRELIGHSKEWFSFTKLPFAYEPTAKCPRFLAFLESIWEKDDDAKDCLKLWFGYLLLSRTNDQKMAVLIGSSRGGKGVLIRVMKSLLGKANSIDMSMNGLMSEFGLAQAIGKRLLTFGDVANLPFGQGSAVTERLLMLTGGDGLDVNRKFKDVVSVNLQVKLVLACNEFPRFMNSRSALTNRLIVFPFSKSFFGKEDLLLDQTLEGELPGIMNWALEGAKRIIDGERLRMPNASLEVVDEIMQSLDSVYAFVAQRVRVLSVPVEKHLAITAEAFFKKYVDFCKESGFEPKSITAFLRSFKHHTSETVVMERLCLPDGSRPRVYPNIEVLGVGAEFDKSEDF